MKVCSGVGFFTVVATVLLLSGCQADGTLSSTTSEDLVNTENKFSPAEEFSCLEIQNTRNEIDTSYSEYSGDSSPDGVWVNPQFKITNNCGKDVEGIKARLLFQNVVGDTVFRGNFVVDETIPFGTTLTTSESQGYSFSKFDDTSSWLKTLNADKTVAQLEVQKVVFSDGTIVEVE
jgi:hypothetical protein